MNIRVLFCVIFFVLYNTSDAQDNNQFSNDINWVTQSQEYEFSCKQIYIAAWISLRNRLDGVDEPIIIMDLDETVLNNSQYQVELFKQSEKYNPVSWNKWVKKEIATLVPGVKDFIIRYKKKKNSKIIYISNRDVKTLKATQNNMKKLGIFFDDDIFLLREDKDDTKIIRREEVLSGIGRMQNHGPKKVLAYFGDAMGDFPNDDNYQFAINKFIFPNPMYGKW